MIRVNVVTLAFPNLMRAFPRQLLSIQEHGRNITHKRLQLSTLNLFRVTLKFPQRYPSFPLWSRNGTGFVHPYLCATAEMGESQAKIIAISDRQFCRLPVFSLPHNRVMLRRNFRRSTLCLPLILI